MRIGVEPCQKLSDASGRLRRGRPTAAGWPTRHDTPTRSPIDERCATEPSISGSVPCYSALRLHDSSDDTDEQYEGCLSFFYSAASSNARSASTSNTRPSTATSGSSPSSAPPPASGHTIDHLAGTLYVDRMRPGIAPVPVEHYTGTGERWRY